MNRDAGRHAGGCISIGGFLFPERARRGGRRCSAAFCSPSGNVTVCCDSPVQRLSRPRRGVHRRGPRRVAGRPELEPVLHSLFRRAIRRSFARAGTAKKLLTNPCILALVAGVALKAAPRASRSPISSLPQSIASAARRLSLDADLPGNPDPSIRVLPLVQRRARRFDMRSIRSFCCPSRSRPCCCRFSACRTAILFGNPLRKPRADRFRRLGRAATRRPAVCHRLLHQLHAGVSAADEPGLLFAFEPRHPLTEN